MGGERRERREGRGGGGEGGGGGGGGGEGGGGGGGGELGAHSVVLGPWPVRQLRGHTMDGGESRRQPKVQNF